MDSAHKTSQLTINKQLTHGRFGEQAVYTVVAQFRFWCAVGWWLHFFVGFAPFLKPVATTFPRPVHMPVNNLPVFSV